MAISMATQAEPTDIYEPTGIERRLYCSLDALGVAFEPQYPVGYYRLDSYLPAYKLAIEVDGCDWHGCLLCGLDSDWDRERRARDTNRDRRLLAVYGIATVRLAGHDMTYDGQALATVRAALVVAGVLASEEQEPAPETRTPERQDDQPERKEHEHSRREQRGHHARRQELARRSVPCEQREEQSA